MKSLLTHLLKNGPLSHAYCSGDKNEQYQSPASLPSKKRILNLHEKVSGYSYFCLYTLLPFYVFQVFEILITSFTYHEYITREK